MNIRYRTRLTREGWHYLFVTCFILGGAILRDVNLLVILAGMMLGPVLFGWRWAKVSLRRLAVRRQLPAEIVAGETFSVDVVVTNQRSHLRSWSLLCEDTVEPDLPLAPKRGRWLGHLSTAAAVLIPRVAAGESAQATYRVRLPRRGRYRFGPARLSTSFPLGLVRASARLRQSDTIIAYPPLGRLSRHWQQVVQGRQAGSQMTQRRGLSEGDYYGLRDWRSGDSRRWIHWRTSAKRGQLSVLQFEQPRDRELLLCLDLWRPATPSDRELGMVEVAISFVATAVADTGRRRALLCLAVAGQESRDWIAPPAPRVCREILEHLAVAEPAPEPRLRLANAEWPRILASKQQAIVVSTRPPDAEFQAALGSNTDQVHWIDVNQDSRYFELLPAGGRA